MRELGVIPVSQPLPRSVHVLLVVAAIASILVISILLGIIGLAKTLEIGGVLVAVCLGMALIRTHQDALMAAICIGVGVLIDWYHLLAWPFGVPTSFAALIALAVIGYRLLTRSAERPWILPPHAWLWVLLAVLAAPAILMGVNLVESLSYYGFVMVIPPLMYLLGTLVALDMSQVRRLLSLLAGLGTLIAIHSIIEEFTGVFLLKTTFASDYLASNQNFSLYGNSTLRAGSLLLNPDSNGTFLAVIVTLPIGLFVGSRSWQAKVIYGIEVTLIVIALLTTYSVGAFVSLAGGLLASIALLGSNRARFGIFALLCATGALLFLIFPSQLALLLAHGTDGSVLLLRIGIWQTAIRIIQAHPLTGIGLGQSTYTLQEDFYRVTLQNVPVPTPHNSYLELAAMAGLPVLVVFLAILGNAFWRTFSTLKLAARHDRLLLASIIAAAITLSINSLEGIGWTLRPVEWMMWLLFGAASSPLLVKALIAGNLAVRNQEHASL